MFMAYHWKRYTNASFRISIGMSMMASLISAMKWPGPPLLARSSASSFSVGSSSGVDSTEISTVAIEQTEPRRNAG